jgi:ATP-binding cassette, subfamily B, bacterial
MNITLRQYWQLLIQYLKPQRRLAALLAVFLLGSIALQLLTPQIMRRFIDSVMDGSPLAVLVNIALLFLGVAVVQQAVSLAAIYTGENVGWTATNALRADLAQHCLKLDLSFHNAHSPGEMIERLDGDINNLSNFFSQFVIGLAGNGMLLVGILVLLWREDWRIGSALTAFSLVALFILARFRNLAVPHFTAERQASAELFGFLEERLSGTEDIRANGGRVYVLRLFYQRMRTLFRRSLKAALMINILLNTLWFLFALGTAVAFAIGASLYTSAILTIGTVYIVFQYTAMLEQPIHEIIRQMQDLQKVGAGITRVQELLNTTSKIQSMPVSTAHIANVPLSGSKALALEFEEVTFGYRDGAGTKSNGNGSGSDGHKPEEAPYEIVLQDISFRLEPGKVLGLLGRTGSGKTSLTRLLFRFYDPDQGTIRMGMGGGNTLQDLRRLPLAHLRGQVGMITQNVQLFNASVRDNLTFFDPAVQDTHIWSVINDLGMQDWFKRLPGGLDTVLESGGSGLSAGEAQLLALMRIFLKDPGLVVLDEASSHLDPATEHLIDQAVDRLVHQPPRTAVIVAHRLATVQRADEIMILENGRIAEHGDRTALGSNSNSLYYHLLQSGMEEVLA